MKKTLILFWMLAAGAVLRASEPAPTLAPEVTPAPGTDPAPPLPVRPSGPKVDTPADLGKYRSIIERAPFRNTLMPQTSAAGGSPANPQLRLNGILRIGDKISAGIEDTVQKRSLILPVGRNEEGIEIRAIDEQTQTVSLFYNGQPMTLTIEKTPGSSGLPMPAPGQSPALMMQTPAGIQRFPELATNNITPSAIKRKRIIIPRER